MNKYYSKSTRYIILLAGVHTVLNIVLFLYINKNDILIKSTEAVFRHPSMLKYYIDIFLYSIFSHGLFFYLILHFSLITAALFFGLLVISILCYAFKIKRTILFFSLYSGILFSLVYFILIYNFVTMALFESKVYKWNIQYLPTITQRICTTANINIITPCFSLFMLILIIICIHYAALKQLNKYFHKREKPTTYIKRYIAKPVFVLILILLCLNLAWTKQELFAKNNILLSWTLDDNEWNFNSIAFSIDTHHTTPTGKYLKKLEEFNETQKNTNFKLPNIIILVVDTFRADHLGYNGYHRDTTPFLDSLYRAGKIENARIATSTCSETMCGIGSTLLSKSYSNMKSSNIRLQSVLETIGYKLRFYSSDIPNYKGLYRLYSADNTDIYNCDTTHKYAALDDHVILEGIKHLKKYSDGHYFFFFHIMSAHALGNKFEGFTKYTPSKCVSSPTTFSKEKSLIDGDTNFYDNGVKQADYVINNIYEGLKSNGYLENSIIIILGDHGEGLGEHGYFNHAYHLYHEFINIPILFIRTDHGEKLYLDYASQIDIAPTILNLINIPIPSTWEGNALTAEHKQRKTYHQTTWSAPILSIIQKNNDQLYKYIKNKNQCIYYYLNQDPGEQNPLPSSCDIFNPQLN
ncbi:sulfatase-like hydrolase/transferase [Solidesulfovibrio sp. C21]|uniref:sulfatase-like hydrolase/transferase n=1 Tax=Solidesulfovibrio sp. C21 TaxID=3398613 RepID=UPI0039FC5968